MECCKPASAPQVFRAPGPPPLPCLSNEESVGISPLVGYETRSNIGLGWDEGQGSSPVAQTNPLCRPPLPFLVIRLDRRPTILLSAHDLSAAPVLIAFSFRLFFLFLPRLLLEFRSLTYSYILYTYCRFYESCRLRFLFPPFCCRNRRHSLCSIPYLPPLLIAP